MTRALALVALAALAGCHQPRTEAVVVISTDGIRVPEDVASLHVLVIDKASTGDDPVFERNLFLCTAASSANCFTLPVTMTLIPGSIRPHDSVRVLVEALAPDSHAVIADAALFTFAEGQSQRLDFVLYANCLGNIDCAHLDLACGPEDRCIPITPMTFSGEPDLMAGPIDLSIGPDFGAEDLAPRFGDLASSDLAHVDLAGCAPQCSGRMCGDDQCLGVCGACTGFTFCQNASGACLDCGAETQFCCANSVCKFGLVCDGTNHCVMPAVGLEPPCGMATQMCCPGMMCDPGLDCDLSSHCFPPLPDMTPPPPMDMMEPPMEPPCGLIDQVCCDGTTCFQGVCQAAGAMMLCEPDDMSIAPMDQGMEMGLSLDM